MGMFLNSSVPREIYREVLREPYFVDKSMLLAELIPALGRKNRFFCITRPRRFGKTVMAGMIGAFFGKTQEPEELFEHLAISQTEGYRAERNQYHVIYIDFSRVPEQCCSYKGYISRITDGLKEDIRNTFPGIETDGKAVWDILQEVREREKAAFVFVMDEWDAVFHLPFLSASERQEYLLFLKNLLKDQTYVALAYMTGVLPIVKYSSGSELNMFVEYDMALSERFSGYFGFSDAEVDRLYEIYRKRTARPRFSREELRVWYDGYYTAAGNRLYNPRSVVLALTDNQLRSYWTGSGPYDELFYFIRNNVEEVRDDLVLMAAGEGIRSDIGMYAAVSMEIHSKEQIYSAMVVYGLLTYTDGKVLIPNKELMEFWYKLV